MNQTIEPIADSVTDAATRLGVSRSLIYLEIKAERLRAIKLRGRTLITRDEQDRFVRSLSAQLRHDPHANLGTHGS